MPEEQAQSSNSIPRRYAAFIEERHSFIERLVGRAEACKGLHWVDEEGHEELEFADLFSPSGYRTRYRYHRAVYVIPEDAELLGHLESLREEQQNIMQAASPPLEKVPHKLLLPHLVRDATRIDVSAYGSFSSRTAPLGPVLETVTFELEVAKNRREPDEGELERLGRYLANLNARWSEGERKVRVRTPNLQVEAAVRYPDEGREKLNLRLVGLICVSEDPSEVIVQLPHTRSRKGRADRVTIEPDAKIEQALVYGERRWQGAKGRE